MNKSLLLVFSILMSSFFLSCGEKSKEEKFLSDFEEMIEKAEEVKTKEDVEIFIKSLELFEKKAESLYGIKNFDALIESSEESISESGLNFTDEQKERFFKLLERMINAAKKSREINNSKEASETHLGSESETDLEPEKDKSMDFKGSVDKYPVTMHLEINGTQVKGSYYYDRQGSSAKLKLLGTIEEGIMDINETDADGTPTGHFRGKYSDGVYSGHFITNQGKKMPFKLYEDGASGFSSDNDIDYSNYDSDDTDLSLDNESDASIEDFLNEYEKFWKRYMSFVKKANKSDPTTMIEYGKLLNDYNNLNKRLQKIKSDLSIDQLNRMNKMNIEMMSEMQKMK